MDRLLYIAMSGAKEAMTAQAINSNNLANANTIGFRADFQASLTQQLYGPGHDSRAYATVADAGVDFAPGSIMSTGNELDVAINGDGWIAIQAPDGGEAYTRAGDFSVDNLGRVTTGAGHPVLGNGGPITIPPYAKLDIAADGTISIQPLGQSANALAIIDRVKMVNPELSQLEKGEDGMIRMKDDAVAVADASVKLVSGSLEGSNVNTVQALVRMIELARMYETHIKMMNTAEKNDSASADMVRLT